MRKQLRKWLGMSFLAACLWSGQSMMAQSVISRRKTSWSRWFGGGAGSIHLAERIAES